jgi:hypothetical protein
MIKLKCSVCEADIEIKDSAKVGERFTCPNCFAQLALKMVNGEKVARCAVCAKGKETMECTDDCERKISYEETKGFPFPE